MWQRNRSGPSTVPCGTPDSTVIEDDKVPSTTSCMERSVRKHFSQEWMGPLMAIAGQLME